jgi:hypothetical protein
MRQKEIDAICADSVGESSILLYFRTYPHQNAAAEVGRVNYDFTPFAVTGGRSN